MFRKEISQILLFIRKNKSNKKILVFYILGLLTGSILGMILDVYFTYNFLFNTIRAIVSVLIGASSYSILYLISIKYYDYKIEKNNLYLTLRERFSYYQRINISLITIVLAILLNLIFVRQGSIFYTIISGFVITLGFALISFSRANRKEYIRASYGLDDPRDLSEEPEIKK